jgi:hypothetical protein
VTLQLTAQTCSVEPFVYLTTPQPVGEAGASGSQINEQSIEEYLNRLREAICADLEAIIESAISGTITEFIELEDVPQSYAGAGGQAVAVKAGEDGLEFIPFPSTPDAPSFERLSFVSIQLGTSAGVTATTNYMGFGGALGVNGTLAFGPIAAGGVRSSTPRRIITSGPGAGSSSSIKTGTASWFRGSTANAGGFRFAVYFGTASAVAQQRLFIGMHSAGGVIGNVNPSTLLNCFGVGYDSAQTTFRLIHNDTTVGAVTTDLGANFPVNTTDWFFLEIIAEPNASSMEYRLVNVTTGNETSGSIATRLPVDSTFLNAHLWCNNGTTAAAVTLDFTVFLIETRQ